MKTVVVLGAGASHALVQTPLGSNLVWTYYQDCAPFHSVPFEGESAYKMFLEMAGKLHPKAFDRELERFDLVKQEGMMYFAPQERMNKYHYVDDMLRKVQETHDGQGVELLKSLIHKHIVSKGNNHHLGYEALKKHFPGFSGLSIISLNFDTFLNERPPGPCFDYRLGFDWIDKYRINYYPGKGIPLLKLNGSLDWVICSAGHLGLLNYFVVHNSFSKKCDVSSCRSKIEPLIATPHGDYDNRFKLLWDEAGQALNEADKVVIIGYSFPDYDTRVMDLFKTNIGNNSIFEVVDVKFDNESDEEARGRLTSSYQTRFPQINSCNLSIHSQGLEEYLKTH